MKTSEYYCWIRAVGYENTTGLGVSGASPAAADGSEKRQFEEAAVAELQMTCPEVTVRVGLDNKPPPSPPHSSPSSDHVARLVHKQQRSILNVSHMTTVHLEQPIARLDLDIDMRPVFGSRDDALRWIESDSGRRFCGAAKAISLICFTVMSDC